eukprot:scaffold4_cov396-Prasinococcus_capsulatus_cf.AAC.19
MQVTSYHPCIKVDKAKYAPGERVNGFAYLTIPAKATAAQLSHLRTVIVEFEGTVTTQARWKKPLAENRGASVRTTPLHDGLHANFEGVANRRTQPIPGLANFNPNFTRISMERVTLYKEQIQVASFVHSSSGSSGSSKGKRSGKRVIGPGLYRFPFSFTIPKDAPSTGCAGVPVDGLSDGSGAVICHTLCLRVENGNLCETIPLVLANVEVGTAPLPNKQVTDAKSETSSRSYREQECQVSTMFGVKKGVLKLRGRTDADTYQDGSRIAIDCQISSTLSGKEPVTQVEAYFMRETYYSANGHKSAPKEEMLCSQTIYDAKKSQDGVGHFETRMALPETLVPSVVTELVCVRYAVVVVVKTKACLGPTLALPICIETAPLTKYNFIHYADICNKATQVARDNAKSDSQSDNHQLSIQLPLEKISVLDDADISTGRRAQDYSSKDLSYMPSPVPVHGKPIVIEQNVQHCAFNTSGAGPLGLLKGTLIHA